MLERAEQIRLAQAGARRTLRLSLQKCQQRRTRVRRQASVLSLEARVLVARNMHTRRVGNVQRLTRITYKEHYGADAGPNVAATRRSRAGKTVLPKSDDEVAKC